MKYFNSLFLALMATAVSGCALDTVEEKGESCPNLKYVVVDGVRCEAGSTETQCKSSDIQDSFKDLKCPVKMAKCSINSAFEAFCAPVQCNASEQMVLCGSSCIKSSDNNDFCGAVADCMGENAGTQCDEGTTCQAGVCSSTERCPAGQIMCSDGCITPSKDKEYCGASEDCTGSNAGTKCLSEQSCQNGSCVCNDGKMLCDEACVDTQADSNHCGDCQTKCSEDSGQICRDGKCKCPDGLTLCDDKCVDTVSDFDHCGSCDKACTGTDVCSKGICRSTCEEGLTICNGACIDMASMHIKSCSGGKITCMDNYADCDGNAATGCEVDGQTDILHCGARGNCKTQNIFNDDNDPGDDPGQSEKGDPDSDINTEKTSNSRGKACIKNETCQSGICTCEVRCGEVCLFQSELAELFVAFDKKDCSCMKGHLDGDHDMSNGCEQMNTIEDCNGVNCTTEIDRWKDGLCDNGVCHVTECDSSCATEYCILYSPTKFVSGSANKCSAENKFMWCSNSDYQVKCTTSYCCRSLDYCENASKDLENCQPSMGGIPAPPPLD